MTIVANISKHDTLSRRFNNYDARLSLLKYGIDSKFICWTKPMGPSDYSQQAKSTWWSQWTPELAKYGRATGNINGYYRNASAITALDFYKTAEVLHFHIVHDEFLSLRDWLKIADHKPLVWTWHDPYMLTGHCVYPLDCKNYQSGCQTCPHLDYYFPIQKDRSRLNLLEKSRMVKKIDPLVIVASEYMESLVRSSVYRDQVRLKRLPFGVELPMAIDQSLAKIQLGIPQENIVIGFRATPNVFKSVGLILEALRKLQQSYPDLPTTIITFDHEHFCDEFSPSWQVIDAGWVDGDQIGQYYSSMDLYLMPSIAEAFGLMAIEALAAGVKPIVADGTSLPHLVNAPHIGVSCKPHVDDLYRALVAEIQNLSSTNIVRDSRKQFANQQYGLEEFCRKMADIYHEEYLLFHHKNR
jgi:glycosyltransferase involved in cell wall biosynthesis